MSERRGEFSTPIKLIIIIVAGVVVLLIYVTIQEGLLESVKDPISAYAQAVVGGI